MSAMQCLTPSYEGRSDLLRMGRMCGVVARGHCVRRTEQSSHSDF
jgi:hypothetical protein